MSKYISDKNSLRNTVDALTSGWDNRTDDDVERITEGLQAGDHPAWDDDWSDYIEKADFMSLAYPDDDPATSCPKEKIDHNRPVLHNYRTGAEIRNVTQEELDAAIEADEWDGGPGIIKNDAGDYYIVN